MYTIRLGTKNDIDSLEYLYDDLNDYLEMNTNYPGWKKGIYPVRQNAIDGIDEGCLFVMMNDEKIVGSMILRHKPEQPYLKTKWQVKLDYNDVLVIYTFVVHPKNLNQGIGTRMLEFAEQYAKNTKVKSLRLDVYEKNTPAIHLYEKNGYQYVDTVSLGLEEYGLNWFKLYEKVLY